MGSDMGSDEVLTTPLDGLSAGPVVPRLVLGARLRTLRDERRIDRKSVV